MADEDMVPREAYEAMRSNRDDLYEQAQVLKEHYDRASEGWARVGLEGAKKDARIHALEYRLTRVAKALQKILDLAKVSSCAICCDIATTAGGALSRCRNPSRERGE